MPRPLAPGSAIPMLNGSGISAPTYTQTPNELFAALPHLTDPQLRCLLIVIRFTLGYHRVTCTASLTDLQRETGLSRNAVIKAARELGDAGIITQTLRYPTSHWRLNIAEDTNINLGRRS